MADWPHVSALWTSTVKMYETNSAAYLIVLLSDALLAAARGCVTYVRQGIGVRHC